MYNVGEIIYNQEYNSQDSQWSKTEACYFEYLSTFKVSLPASVYFLQFIGG